MIQKSKVVETPLVRTFEAFQGFWNDSHDQHLPKSAIFETMG